MSINVTDTIAGRAEYTHFHSQTVTRHSVSRMIGGAVVVPLLPPLMLLLLIPATHQQHLLLDPRLGLRVRFSSILSFSSFPTRPATPGTEKRPERREREAFLTTDPLLPMSVMARHGMERIVFTLHRHLPDRREAK